MPVAQLKRMKVKFLTDGNDGKFVSGIKLPFTPSQWVGIVSKEGPWLPMCCGNLSDARDIFVTILREDGWMDPSQLIDILSLISTHDGFKEICGKKKVRNEARKRGDPLAIFFDIWDAVRGSLKGGDGDKDTLDPADWRDAASMLNSGTLALRWHTMFAKPDFVGEKGQVLAARDEFHRKMVSLTLLKDLVPAVNTLHTELPRLAPEPIDGFALVDKKTQKIGETMRGLAIFLDKKEADEILGIWAERNKKARDQFNIQPVHMSLKGIEFR